MDIFDQFLFEELAMQYAQTNLTKDDYEELYMRFCNLNHLTEVQPYLQTMRFWGLGTTPEKDAVLSELKAILSGEDYMLKGLYYDLLLSENDSDTNALVNLRQMVDKGYTNIFTKEKSNVEKAGKVSEYSSHQKNLEIQKLISLLRKIAANKDDVTVDYIIFECRDFNGLYFTAGDVDYLSAKVFIKPFCGKRHIKVRSQIYLGDEPFSKVFSNEYDITPETRWLRTTGWGNTNYTCYCNNTYRWVIEIDGKTTFSQNFRMYSGEMNKSGPRVNDIKLFASKASGALEKDRDSYKTIFDGNSLEYIYFKFLISEPGENMNVQAFIKITCLEDDSVFWDDYFIQPLDNNTIAFWKGIGYAKPGSWKKGLYHYSAYVGNKPKFEGTFTVC